MEMVGEITSPNPREKACEITDRVSRQWRRGTTSESIISRTSGPHAIARLRSRDREQSTPYVVSRSHRTVCFSSIPQDHCKRPLCSSVESYRRMGVEIAIFIKETYSIEG